MMDDLLDGFIAGSFGPPFGGFLSRFSLLVAVVIGLAVGLVFNIGFCLYEIVVGGGLSHFISTFYVHDHLIDTRDLVAAAAIMPVICACCFFIIRVLSPPPTLEQAQAMLEGAGYQKRVLGDGRRVSYERGDMKFIFWDDRRYGAPKVEWWRNGKAKGTILLSDSE